MSTAVYPTIDDFDALVASLTPAPAFIGDSATFLQVMARPWSEFEAGLQDLVVGLADLNGAAGWVVEVAGRRVNELPGGLGTTEYRRIVAGRQLAAASLGTPADVWAVLLALGGSDVGAYFTLSGGAGAVAVALAVYSPTIPTTPYLIRAGAVLRAALPIDAEATATIYVATTAIFGTSSFGTGATFGYSVPVP